MRGGKFSSGQKVLIDNPFNFTQKHMYVVNYVDKF